MTASFDLEKEAHKISREHCDMDEQEKMIISFGLRCQDEILEKAADLVWKNPHDSSFDANRHANLIRSLKSTAGGDVK